jgi:hypothetical protein
MNERIGPFVVPIIAGLAVGLITVLITRPEPITNILKAGNLLPKPKKETRFYFEDPKSLPDTIVPGQKETFRFTIHNMEYQTMAYPYSVVTETATGSAVASVGTVDLAFDEKKTITQEITFTQSTPTAVIVRLDNTRQILRYRIDATR